MTVKQGCQIFLATTYQNGENIPNEHKIYQMSTRCAKWPLHRLNDHKLDKYLPLQDPPKFTQIVIFGLKTNHLATRLSTEKATGAGATKL
jgi:hypothetical protein